MVVQVTLAADLRLNLADVPKAALAELRDRLSVRNPEWVSRVKRNRPTWGVEPEVSLLRWYGDQLVVPRGAGAVLREVLRAHGHELAVDDARTAPGGLRLPVPAVELRDYQAAALSACVDRQQGLVVVGTGGGKTTVGVCVAQALGQPTCVVAHTRDLVDQWVETFRRLLGVQAGIVGAGKAEWAPVTVATVQTLQRLPRVELEARAREFGCFILDECHHASATTYHEVVGAFPARYRIGFTATPDRDDGTGDLVEHLFGPRLIEVGVARLVSEGYLAEPRIVPVETEFRREYSGPQDWEPLLRDLVADPWRNVQIAQLAVREAEAGHIVLVLSGRVEHCEVLAAIVRELGTRTEAVTGQNTTAKRRRQLLEEFRAGQLPVMVASTLADEGLDVPCVDRAILAFPGKSATKMAQRLGRILRKAPGKGEPVLYDLVDELVGVLAQQARKRQRTFAEVLGLPLPGRSRRQEPSLSGVYA